MLINFYALYKEQSYLNRFIYLSIFLLPIFSISVRHWGSGISILIFLLSTGVYFKNKNISRELFKEEKNYIYILLFYFIIFLLSSVVNGWGDAQTHILGTMLRFIAIIPMLYMFRDLKYVLVVLTLGSIFACMSNIIYLYFGSTTGIYSHLFSGPMTFLFSVFIIPVIIKFQFNIVIKTCLIILLLLSILTVFELGSRSAFVAMLMIMIFYLLIYTKSYNRIYFFLFIVIVSIGSYYGNDNVAQRIDRITTGLSVYYSESHPEQATEKLNVVHDIAARLEMWRAGKYFLVDNPILGFGPNEFEKEIQELINEKLISSVASASHPHNAYLKELFSKGLLGLIAMLLVLYYPAYIFIRSHNENPYVSTLGLSVIVSFSAFSMTESAAFNNNNFSSIMLVYITILFVSLFQRNDELKK